MATKTVKCPKCQHLITISGNPGEKIHLTCSKCNTQGVYTFPLDPVASTPKRQVSSSAAIEVRGLTKHFNGVKAVNNISFTVRKGEIFGFLGPNGAGKTTTIRMITTLIKPSQGRANVCGFDVLKNPIDAKKKMGFMPDVPGFYGEMKAYEVLDFYASFYKIPKKTRKEKIDELFEMMQLTEFKNRKVKTYSRGMKQKLCFASSIINDPELLILDEPTIGLDPATIHFFRKTLQSLNEKGVTIFLSSHILSEVQAICTKVGIINKGKIVAVDTIGALRSKTRYKGDNIVSISYDKINDNIIKIVEKIPGVLSVKNDNENKKLEIELEKNKSVIPIINKTLVENDVAVTGITKKEVNLEDIFLSLVGGDQNE